MKFKDLNEILLNLSNEKLLISNEEIRVYTSEIFSNFKRKCSKSFGTTLLTSIEILCTSRLSKLMHEYNFTKYFEYHMRMAKCSLIR